MKERLRNIGLEPETHRALKMLCAENDWTMTQAIEHLMERLRNDGSGSNQPAGQSGATAGGEPGSADRDGKK